MQPDLSLGYDRFSNGIAVPGGHRFYGFQQPPPGPDPLAVISYFSTDGATWTREPELRPAFDQPGYEGKYVKDPAVVRLADGRYIMLYVTRIPGQ